MHTSSTPLTVIIRFKFIYFMLVCVCVLVDPYHTTDKNVSISSVGGLRKFRFGPQTILAIDHRHMDLRMELVAHFSFVANSEPN